MYRIKTKDEFEEMKQDMLQKVDNFVKDWDEFTRYVSPKHWQGMGRNFKPTMLKDDIMRYEPATQKHLDNELFRDEVFTDEEKEEWNATQKYNI